jgi:hypothetical protein
LDREERQQQQQRKQQMLLEAGEWKMRRYVSPVSTERGGETSALRHHETAKIEN